MMCWAKLALIVQVLVDAYFYAAGRGTKTCLVLVHEHDLMDGGGLDVNRTRGRRYEIAGKSDRPSTMGGRLVWLSSERR
ncbi:hypothetical protein M406DRAFT_103437 [Cryphonectria parasitica EP155]|uniref:Secreted protein n=1 Tax=Cryphonectria parasitica (strain ATCC 38755 / EP155) TaxID=660469 RepID=A0A9P4XTF0_CRYP1|nr:uncharacterized protein M406DRAFT_103437 [Cryphonectria parasitica EP155]KAF3760664.1 hypothetical protein M406DRAFT_103437 [Cryphonectria parasitica EP155]